MTRKARVLLVDDSPLVLNILSKIVNADARLEVVATARSGVEGIAAVEKYQPDVICTDYHMPKMGGLEFIEWVMSHIPTPILVVSISVAREQSDNIFKLLQAGAVDVFPKPRATGRMAESEAKALRDKIFVVSRVHVYLNRNISKKSNQVASELSRGALTEFSTRLETKFSRSQTTELSTARADNSTRACCDLVLIGGSTGAPPVFFSLFERLSANFPVPIVAVQHISPGFVDSFVAWLNRASSLHIKLAEHQEVLKAGTVYFPPDGANITVRDGRVQVDFTSDAHHGPRPSVDALFNSVAQTPAASHTMAILLSGMGRDGADGLAALHARGACTVAQSMESCVIFGMPAEAIKLDAADKVLDPDEIASLLGILTVARSA